MGGGDSQWRSTRQGQRQSATEDEGSRSQEREGGVEVVRDGRREAEGGRQGRRGSGAQEVGGGSVEGKRPDEEREWEGKKKKQKKY